MFAVGASFFNHSDVDRRDEVDIEDLAMTSGRRKLQRRRDRIEKSKGGGSGGGGSVDTAAQKRKVNRMKAFINSMMAEEIPKDFKPADWSSQHRPNSDVIFAAAMYVDLEASSVKQFCGTARKYGFKGDIVIAVYDGTADKLQKHFMDTTSIVYNVKAECTGANHDVYCTLYGGATAYPINMLRYYFYKWWARIYAPTSIVMMSDYRDVMFQSNPFEYRKYEWQPPVAQLTVFQENHPIKVIDRCVFNSGWIASCYGGKALKKIGSNTVSCSGVSFGTRDAIMVYAELILKQLDVSERYQYSTESFPDEKQQKRCISVGMDQGFHNWLVYSGELDKYMNLKIYQQGEGPVNTVGSFGGARAVLKFSLEKWGIVKGESPNKYFYNWNGDKSPVVHQLDRYIDTLFKRNMPAHLGALQNMV